MSTISKSMSIFMRRSTIRSLSPSARPSRDGTRTPSTCRAAGTFRRSEQLFKENRFAKGEFVGLGRRLDLKAIVCPVYLLAGETDDITTREQVFDADKYLGTPKGLIEKKLVPGGHIGLFMGSRNLKETWPSIAQWILRAGGA